MLDVTIVGAGFCGTMTAVQLMRAARMPLHIRLVERTPSQVARGIAYRTTERCHLLNVPAGRMSALPDDPDHFLRWAAAHPERLSAAGWDRQITPDAFLPRGCYGDYLSDLLRETLSSTVRHAVEVVHEEIVRLEFPKDQTVGVHTRTGARWKTDACVLALGQTPPATPRTWAMDDVPPDRYHGNPWAPDVLPRLLQSESCLLLGSGLTMLDVVMALDDHGYQGTIHVLSRRGLVPLAHARADGRKTFHPPPEAFREEPDLRGLLAQMRELAQRNGGSVADWQAAADSLRPHTPSLWRRLEPAQQRRFLRHARPYWDHLRHRVAPSIRERFDALVARGRIRLHVGRTERFTYRPGPRPAIGAAVLRQGNASTTLYVDQLVNCTGPGATLSGENGPLLHGVLRAYPHATDALGLGMAVTDDMRLRACHASPRVFALGPPVRGQLWESTAVPECRAAVGRLVSALTEELRLCAEMEAA